MARISNEAFLNEFLHSSYTEQTSVAGSVILPIDEFLLQLGLQGLAAKTQAIARDRAHINAQSGDSWHDGALNESDREVHSVDRETAKYKARLKDPVVDYPGIDERRVTLGSRVKIDDGKKESIFEIVSFATLHTIEDPKIRTLSLEAPISRHILGKLVGEVTQLHTPRHQRELEIKAIDQLAVGQRDERLRHAS